MAFICIYIVENNDQILEHLKNNHQDLIKKQCIANEKLGSDIIYMQEQTKSQRNKSNEGNLEQIKDIWFEFNANYNKTLLSNNEYDFWITLRFNSYLLLKTFNRIVEFCSGLDKEVEEYIFVNTKKKLRVILEFHFPNSKFINTPKKPDPKIDKAKEKQASYSKSWKIIKKGIIWNSMKQKKFSQTLIISNEIDIVTTLTSKGVRKEDKFMISLLETLSKNSFARMVRKNIFAKNNYAKISEIDIEEMDYYFEAILLKLAFKPKIYVKILKSYFYFRKISKTGEKTLLNKLIIANRNSYFSDLITYESFRYFLKRNKFKNLVLSDEMSPNTNNIVRAAKSLSINVIGIQHGLLNKNNIAYNFSNEELEKNNPFPDHLVVWGKEEDEFLSKNKALLKNIVKPLGNIILDGLKYLPKEKKEKKFTVIFASQPQPIHSLRMKSLTDFIEAIQNFNPEDVKVVIRLHPRELKDYSLYKKEIANLQAYDYEIDNGKELFSQLHKSDALVTSYSTLAQDFMILEKPIILQDYGENDYTGLISKGVAFNAMDSGTLFKLLSDIKSKKRGINKSAYEVALKEQFAYLDFNVAQRIKALLKT